MEASELTAGVPPRVACLAERTDCGPDCSRPVADEDRAFCRETNNRRLLAGKDEQ